MKCCRPFFYLIALFGVAMQLYCGLALADSSIVMRNLSSNVEVTCLNPKNGKFISPNHQRDVAEWCVKACAAHGFSMPDKSSGEFSENYDVSPRLSREFLEIARKNTPLQCLPYEPNSYKSKKKEDCLSYDQRSKVSGMLSNYIGMGLAIHMPSPSCLTKKGEKMPGAKRLSDIIIRNTRSNKSIPDALIGLQVSVMGTIKFEVQGDVGKFIISDVEIITR